MQAAACHRRYQKIPNTSLNKDISLASALQEELQHGCGRQRTINCCSKSRQASNESNHER